MLVSVCCPVCRADVGATPPGDLGDLAAAELVRIHCAARHGEMRVVCAACDVHYGTVAVDGQMAATSERMALEHAGQCEATLDEHSAALAWMEAISTVMDGDDG